MDCLVDSNVLDNLTHVPLNHDLPTMPSPILSPRIEMHLSPRNGEHSNDMAINLTIDGRETESKHPHLLALSTSQLEVPRQMPNV